MIETKALKYMYAHCTYTLQPHSHTCRTHINHVATQRDSKLSEYQHQDEAENQIQSFRDGQCMIDSIIHSEVSKTRMYSNEIAEKFTMTDSLLLILISIIPNPSNNNNYHYYYYYNIIYNYDNYNTNNYTQCVNPAVLSVAINKKY